MEETMTEQGIAYYRQMPYSVVLHQVEDGGQKYWMAEIPELPGCRSHGATVQQAVANIDEAKEAWIADALEQGEPVPLPAEREKHSGKILLRVSRSLHRALTVMADSEGLSLNQLVATALAKEVGRFDALKRVERKLDDLVTRIAELVESKRVA
ncbi:MAG: type II toxin-antitoxin system HicB family antitoxin [Chloroflexi bacterium]|nr:type II toxin-antitoxin system HicB family antitoxin [Chloroflexota bacterium]